MKEIGEIVIGQLSLDDMPHIVEVHEASFPCSAMTRLGTGAVRRYYEWQFTGPHEAHFISAKAGGHLAGFCVCGTFRGALGGFVSRNGFFLASKLLLQPRLLLSPEVRAASWSALRAVCRRTLSPKRDISNGGLRKSFGILSIAVAPQFRRRGVGENLMARADQIAMEREFSRIGLTVRPENVSAIRFYERLGWYRVMADPDHWDGAMSKTLS